ncbi:MAG: hypothetical protein AMXMBFR47_36600 [Planctomycetota bacterium]
MVLDATAIDESSRMVRTDAGRGKRVDERTGTPATAEPEAKSSSRWRGRDDISAVLMWRRMQKAQCAQRVAVAGRVSRKEEVLHDGPVTRVPAGLACVRG